MLGQRPDYYQSHAVYSTDVSNQVGYWMLGKIPSSILFLPKGHQIDINYNLTLYHVRSTLIRVKFKKALLVKFLWATELKNKIVLMGFNFGSFARALLFHLSCFITVFKMVWISPWINLTYVITPAATIQFTYNENEGRMNILHAVHETFRGKLTSWRRTYSVIYLNKHIDVEHKNCGTWNYLTRLTSGLLADVSNGAQKTAKRKSTCALSEQSCAL